MESIKKARTILQKQPKKRLKVSLLCQLKSSKNYSMKRNWARVRNFKVILIGILLFLSDKM
jgi:hypothetical protein